MFKRLIDAVTLGSERPLGRLIAYYAILIAALGLLLFLYPASNALMMGAEPTTSGVSPQLLQDGLNGPAFVQQLIGPGSLGELMINTLLVILGILALMLPVTWVYMSARRVPGHDQPVVQTLLILPIVVAGIVLIVQNSLALAFSLAGVVAAVRFRTTLRDARDLVFIFLAIAVGFAGGVQAMILGAMVSILFNFILIMTWRYDFGRSVLEPTAASQWNAPLKELSKRGTGVSVPDRDLVLALDQKQVLALSQRFDRVRKLVGPPGKKARYNAILIITTENLTDAQSEVAEALDDVARRW